MSVESLRVAKQLSQEAFDLAGLAQARLAGSDREVSEAHVLALLALERRIAVVGVILDARLSELDPSR